MDLYRNKDGAYFRWLNPYWYTVLKLARRYGWKPLGTKIAGNPQWDGSYETNDYQIVTSKDAKAMAAALEKVLPDIPNEDATAHKKLKINNIECFPEWCAMNCFEKLSQCKSYLKEFIAYMRVDGFTIQ